VCESEERTLGTSLGSLGDFFPDKDIRCRIRGCNNVWQFSGADALHNVAQGKSTRPDRMCDECFAEFSKLTDKQVVCSTAECTHTWNWNRFAQLEAAKQGHTTPPRGFCEACKANLKKIKDAEVPCRMKGCERTWTWRKRDQMLSEDGKSPVRFCETCFGHLKRLQDVAVTCRMHGCDKTWHWNRYQQLEHIVAGKNIETHPKRMCQACFDTFKTLQDQNVPCKIDECKRTWVFNRYDQLEYKLKNGDESELPSKMCHECYRFFLDSRDRQLPCVVRGCRHTWTYTRSSQLHDWLNKRGRPGPRMCEECQKQLKELTPQDVECMVPGCSKTWSHPPEDQLRDQRQGKREPTAKRCPGCEEFLQANKPKEIPCEHCAKPIHWSSYEQLLCSLETFVKPTRCTACAGQELAMERPPERFHADHHLIVRMPPNGPWQKDDRISHWPPHLTYDVIGNVEKADVRIVAFGDDLTVSAESVEKSWPFLLEKALNEALGEKLKVAVVNAGIRRCTSRQAVQRFARDVAPFRPDLILFSFAFGDSLLRLNHRTEQWSPNIAHDEVGEAQESLFKKLSSTPAKLLYWTTNPVFPEDELGEKPSEMLRRWVRAQEATRDHCLRDTRHLCVTHNIPTLDLRSRFEVNGVRSAKRWMADWYMHNDTGGQNIATWFAQHILNGELLPKQTPKD